MEIKNDGMRNKFYFIEEGKEGYIDYKINKEENTIEYIRTFLPEEIRGKGYAEKLAVYALDYARQQGYTVIPTCPFIKKIMERQK